MVPIWANEVCKQTSICHVLVFLRDDLEQNAAGRYPNTKDVYEDCKQTEIFLHWIYSLKEQHATVLRGPQIKVASSYFKWTATALVRH